MERPYTGWQRIAKPACRPRNRVKTTDLADPARVNGSKLSMIVETEFNQTAFRQPRE